MQRFLDILLSFLALIVLAPLLIPVAVTLRFTGEGEVFFRQQRVGFGGRVFGVLKFATMLKNSPSMGTGTVTLKDDPRVLPFGKLLRKTKINELPQLLNVLLGEMSLIGPRPQTERCFSAFPRTSQTQIVRVRPGLSGVGSVIFRGEEGMMHASNDPDAFYDKVIMPYKGELECWYVRNQGVRIYLKCLMVTVWIVLFPSSKIAWSVFNGVPLPPKELAAHLNFSQ